MGTNSKVPSPAVLKNRGVPVPVHALVDGSGTSFMPPERVFNDADEFVIQDVYVQLTNNVLSDIEDPDLGFGGLGEWQFALDSKSYNAMRKTLAIVWGYDPRNRADMLRVGAMMVDGKIDVYTTAVGVSFMIANGLDPTQAGELLTLGFEAAKEKRDEMLKRMETIVTQAMEKEETETTNLTGTEQSSSEEMVESLPVEAIVDPVQPETVIPGTNGYETGLSTEENLTSSGV